MKAGLNFSEEDIVEAMSELKGYIDLTPHDFKELYAKVYQQARRRILESQKAREIMNSPAVAITETASVSELVELLDQKGISGLPVLNSQGLLVGVVSEKDVLLALGERPSAGQMRLVSRFCDASPGVCGDIRLKQVREIMSSPAVGIQTEATLAEVLNLFESRAINRLPVIDSDGLVAGIITRANLITAVSNL